MIGQFCTCDVDNYGDLLYPVILKKLLGKHPRSYGLTAFGFLAGPAPCDSNYDVSDINTVLKKGEITLSHLIIGGGDLLRTDTMLMASHYNSLFEKRLKQSFTFRLKRRIFGTPNLAQLFRRRFMDYGAIGPFLLDQDQYAGVESLLYFSCGVPFAVSDSDKGRVRKAIESAAFVYVRDEQSRKKLVDIGVSRQIDVAPDAIVCLSDYFDKEEEKRKGEDILRRFGIKTDRGIICLQSPPQSLDYEEDFMAALSEIKSMTDAEIVLMPIGFCHRDDVFLRNVAAKSGGSYTYADVRSIYDMISVIAASKVFVGTSMHGNITAFSFGIPHIFGPLQVDKTEGFLNMVGLGPDFKLASWRDTPEKLRMIETLPTDHFTALAADAKKAVRGIMSKMRSVLAKHRA